MRLVLWIALLSGCGEAPCALDANVVPGCGVRTAGGEVRIGDERTEVEAGLGNGVVRDLGPLGVRVDHGDTVVAYTGGAVASLQVGQGFGGATGGGVGPGATEATVTDTLGEPVIDLFSDTWWFREQGIAVRFDDGIADTVTVFAPR